VRIARCRVVRRNGLAVVKTPRNQEVLMDTFHDLPGVYMARIISTLQDYDVMSSSNACDSCRRWSEKPPLVNFVLSPRDKFVASCDGSALATSNDDGPTGAGSGECLPELPEGGLPVATTSHRDDLQAGCGSLPVENR
jgi:hypothetical protein